MKPFFIRPIIYLLLGCCCGCKNNQADATSAKDSSFASGIGSSVGTINKDRPNPIPVNSEKEKLGVMFYQKKPFKIISFSKGFTLEYSGEADTIECQKWRISREDVPRIFKNSEPISGLIWDLAFVFTACVATGQLIQGEELFNYSINAGAWFRVDCRDTSLLFGNFNKYDKKYFLYEAELN